MSTPPLPEIRNEQDFAQELRARIAGYLPAWQPGIRGTDAAILAAAARFLASIGTRRNLTPGKNLLAFLQTAGITPIPASSARAPMIFAMDPTGVDAHLAAGSRISAPPPPGSDDEIFFETEEDAGLAATRLVEAVSIHPGRDQFADHAAAIAAGTPFTSFAALTDTEHILYCGHKTICNLAGNVTITVSFSLAEQSSEPLDLTWEYWDGKVWRPFKSVLAQCDEDLRKDLDGTRGLTKSGTITLSAGCAETKPLAINGIETFWIRGRLIEPLPSDPTQVLPLVAGIKVRTVASSPLFCVRSGQEPAECSTLMNDTNAATTEIKTGLLPDKALTGTSTVDLSKPFYPLGQQPQPGSVFYIASAEVFGKPGARAQIVMKVAPTPEGEVGISSPVPLAHSLVWEYWNGTDWIALSMQSANGSAEPDFTHSNTFQFTVPDDMTAVKVNNEDALWVRARLASGGFGFKSTVTWTDAASGTTNSFTYVIPVPPAIGGFRLGYTWESLGEAPDAVLAYNDFQVQDFSEQAKYPGRPFLPFSRMQDTTPAVYMGFEKQLPVDFLGIFFDVVERTDTDEAPPLVWEYWDGADWQRLAVSDETGHLSRPGIVHFVGPEDSSPLARFGTARHWIRARMQEDGPPLEQTVNAALLNAVWASQRQTIRQETLGQSNGLPNQIFPLRQFPVLEGETIEVRELAGALAPIEFPVLRDSVGESRIRTVTDRNGVITEVWVTWEGRPHLFFSGPEDRQYVVTRETGQIQFGDGEHGLAPVAGATILAAEYRAGGGASGNLPAGAINQPLVGIAGLQEVFNALPGEGGSETEPVSEIVERGPATVRHRGRAVTARDYAVMAYEASPEVAWVRVFAGRDAYLGRRAGHVLLLILPETNVTRPWPSFGLRERVRKYLEERAPAPLTAEHTIHVTGPEYYPVDVAVTVVPRVADEAGRVERSVRSALEEFLHPLRGGPAGKGWELGRDVYLSDIATVVESVEGVDAASGITLLHDDTPQGTRVAVPRHQLVVAGRIRIRVTL